MRALLAAFAVLFLAACTTERVSAPQRTATEQLLISTAADRAAHNLGLKLPTDRKFFVDATNFEGTDGKYAISAIKDELLRRGVKIVADRNDADGIVEIRSGALSIDQSTAIVGVPQFEIPIPAAGNFTFPEIALFKKEEKQGVAKFAAFGYSTRTGELIATADPDYGFSTNTQWVVALFLSWNTSDLIPEDATKASSGDYFFNGSLPIERQDLPFYR